jgi:hypothetical protein
MKQYDTMGFESEYGVWVRAADASHRIRELELDLRKYGSHGGYCKARRGDESSCGFDAVLASQSDTATEPTLSQRMRAKGYRKSSPRNTGEVPGTNDPTPDDASGVETK